MTVPSYLIRSLKLLAKKFLADAIKLDDKYKEKAKRNPDFDAIKNEKEFKKITES